METLHGRWVESKNGWRATISGEQKKGGENSDLLVPEEPLKGAPLSPSQLSYRGGKAEN